jgi:restriction system protein
MQMGIPDYQSLMLPLLKRVASSQVSVPEVEPEIATEFGMTQAERDQYLPSGRQKVLHNRLNWAKFYLSKAGLVASEKGRFIATDAGRELLAKMPSRIDNDTLLAYPSFREFYRGESSHSESQSSEKEETSALLLSANITHEQHVEAAFGAMQSALRLELLGRILRNTPGFFEQVIIDLLVAMGYGGSHRNASEQLGRSGDGGVDGVINEDRLGLDRVYVQAKRFSETSIGRPDVQAFVGSLVGLGATKGVFVTTSTFSQQAVEFAGHLSQRVILIDGKRLTDLMIEHNVGVRVSRTLDFKRIDEDFFAEDD